MLPKKDSVLKILFMFIVIFIKKLKIISLQTVFLKQISDNIFVLIFSFKFTLLNESL